MIFYALNNLITFALNTELAMGQQLTAQGYLLFCILSVVFELAIFAVYYTFRSIGLYKMVKNKGGKNPALAIIPFYGLYVANSLAPESKYVKKNEWFYILAIVLGVISTVAMVTLDVMYGIPSLSALISGNMFTSEMIGYSNYLTSIIDIVYALTSLGYVICVVMVFRGVFMSYAFNKGGKYITWSAIVYVFTGSLILLGIFTFAVRNNARFNYDEYFERLSKARQRNPYGQYGPYGGMGGNHYGRGNPYGGQYNGSGYGGYGRPSGWQENPYKDNGQKTEKPADPFEEFENGNASTQNDSGTSNNNQSNENDNSDDFFN